MNPCLEDAILWLVDYDDRVYLDTPHNFQAIKYCQIATFRMVLKEEYPIMLSIVFIYMCPIHKVIQIKVSSLPRGCFQYIVKAIMQKDPVK